VYLGAHVSIAGGFDKCLDRISAMGGNCLMTFASSPRSLKFTPIPESSLAAYAHKKSAFNIGPHFFHGIYLVNLATPDPKLLDLSIQSLIGYQQLAGQIGAVGTIFHIGSHKGRGLSETIDQIVAAINYILDSSPKNTRLILENAAGHTGTVGATFEELAQIISRIGDKPKIGVCLDTQHCFASGVPISKAITSFSQIIGLKHLSVIHLNDSKTDFASHVDRHENLGQGKIGQTDLKEFLADPRLADIPIILEVPGDGSGPTKPDIDLLKSWIVQ
jgi:deoxyribonuclease-4